MKGTEVIQRALKGTAHSLNMYLSDLSDADLLVRTSPNANHIALATRPPGLRRGLPRQGRPAHRQVPGAARRLRRQAQEGHRRQGHRLRHQGGLPQPVQQGPRDHHRRGRQAVRRRPGQAEHRAAGLARADGRRSAAPGSEPRADARRADHLGAPQAGQAGVVLSVAGLPASYVRARSVSEGL